ncbi:UDP-N-acetylenolpyruvoylglucosamine reductase [Geomonas sp. Red276]
MIDIQENVPLAPYTTFEIGGPARYFATATDVEGLREALLFAKREGVPFAILGGGSNVLVNDDGFPGLVVKISLEGMEFQGVQVEVEAGVDLMELVRSCTAHGLSGLEPLAGIPGQVGGAVRGNAGAYGANIGELCRRVRVLNADTLELEEWETASCGFRYRNSRFKESGGLVVVSALLELIPGKPTEIGQRVETTLAKRAARNLQCERSVGSFFMNPVVSDPLLVERFEMEQKVRCRDGRVPAGWLIDRAGLRSTTVGGAAVSHLHANYLINTGGATAAEVVQLARLVKERVLSATGVELQEEVSRLGFSSTDDRRRVPDSPPLP